MNQNVTLSLPSDDVRRARVIAAQRGTSVSRLLADMLRRLIEQDTGYAAARERSLNRLADGWDLGTKGNVTWDRDELHAR